MQFGISVRTARTLKAAGLSMMLASVSMLSVPVLAKETVTAKRGAGLSGEVYRYATPKANLEADGCRSVFENDQKGDLTWKGGGGEHHNVGCAMMARIGNPTSNPLVEVQLDVNAWIPTTGVQGKQPFVKIILESSTGELKGYCAEIFRTPKAGDCFAFNRRDYQDKDHDRRLRMSNHIVFYPGRTDIPNPKSVQLRFEDGLDDYIHRNDFSDSVEKWNFQLKEMEPDYILRPETELKDGKAPELAAFDKVKDEDCRWSDKAPAAGKK